MHATHQFFLTQRSLYLLVLNGREGGEDADAEYWLRLIESFAEDSPVIVVLNKIKEQPFDLNRSGLRNKFPAIRDFIFTDCSDPTEQDEQGPVGIEALRRSIERETDQLEHLRDPFPSSWFAIKDRLGDMASRNENYISFDQFREVCAQNGESDGQAQESLAFYLHSLGIALNYKDDPRLRDMHVLNPHWVTNGIYKILNAADLAKHEGELNIQDLSKILDKNAYPLERHSFLFDLMQKFELCFNFLEDDGRYLIPELLDKQEPPEATASEALECLSFQYDYPILPEGLLPRFIVRTHSLSVGLARWRTGVILEFEGSRAIVKADVPDKKVFVSVSGPPGSRRNLLAVIRSDFESINSSFNFEPKEMVPVPERLDLLVPYQKLRVLETEGIRKFHEVFGDRILELDVEELLNGVDIDGARDNLHALGTVRSALRLFYSYSHKDERLRDEMETHLKILHRRGLIQSWHDRKIEAGDDWKQAIDENLERTDIILLLVSADFIASDYCYEIEMKRAMERHKAGEAKVVPVIVRDVNWQSAPFGDLQVPKDAKALSLWEDKDSAWRNVSEGIEKAVHSIVASR